MYNSRINNILQEEHSYLEYLENLVKENPQNMESIIDEIEYTKENIKYYER